MRTVILACTAILLMGGASPVSAQMVDLPIWSNGILGQQALRNTYENYNETHGVDDGSSAASAACSADALPAAERKRMEAEYVKRARNDGKASADAWVREQGKRFRLKLVADGACPAPSDKGQTASATEAPEGKEGCRMEMRPIANVSGGGMSMAQVPVCD
ncbi:hypothetical protein [Iodidimonas sp. SYSU 1G8]|uniref:hypothetical protein n=1 Tax=Iodidimonas sp. SYSU 1G8 TaxID=3133967 RepID=UPI0031FF28CA